MLDIIKSVLAAFFGVQSDQNRRKDFQRTSPWPYIGVGILMTIIFILLVAFVAHLAAK
ncbi:MULTISPECIES: DUF2970 domain-containing protein [Bacteria]|uniref:DUF2970 domain-containing protein n=1 Tax=Nitrincola nitratireducens TaxID=1229521 RepID=W9V4L8_9GAMM|nr:MULTISPECIES: DUF2970 domain-containing protein [Nitrincola]EXJ11861.1 hypothetical protein D791_01234 [Nitrincola nitratireducens]